MINASIRIIRSLVFPGLHVYVGGKRCTVRDMDNDSFDVGLYTVDFADYGVTWRFGKNGK